MNKRCTNSACRKVFSTLNFEVKCPFCGKAYPQLASTRKAPLGYFCPKDRVLKQARDFMEAWEKVKAIKEIRNIFRSRGYVLGLKEAKSLADGYKDGRFPRKKWKVEGVNEEGLKVLERIIMILPIKNS